VKIGDCVVIGDRKHRAPSIAVVEGRDDESLFIYGLPFPLDTGAAPNGSIFVLRVATKADITAWDAAQAIRAAEEKDRAVRVAHIDRMSARLRSLQSPLAFVEITHQEWGDNPKFHVRMTLDSVDQVERIVAKLCREDTNK
jgi:hypothetical protein